MVCRLRIPGPWKSENVGLKLCDFMSHDRSMRLVVYLPTTVIYHKYQYQPNVDEYIHI